MNVVDSSGWLEYFADGKNADFFADAIEDIGSLIVPVISIYEVFKRILQQRDEDEALKAVGVMVQGNVVELDLSLSLMSARLSHEWKLPMADSIILATAQANDAILYTQDADLKGKPGVRYVVKS
jgi:predicted nucleic acid-binding protein